MGFLNLCRKHSIIKIILGSIWILISIPTISTQEDLKKEFPYNWLAPGEKSLNCPKGWDERGNKCYKVYTLMTTWDSANTICKSVGSKLVEVEDVIENIYVAGLVKIANPAIPSWWIGFQTKGANLEASWSDGRATDISIGYWDENEPIKPTGSKTKRCGLVTHKEMNPWRLTGCEASESFICQREKCLEDSSPCRNGGCVPTSALCDGQNDCGDASDESDCASVKYCTKTETKEEGSIKWPTAGAKKVNDEYYCTLYILVPPGGKIVTTFKSLDANLNHVNVFCDGPSLDQAVIVATIYGDDLEANGIPKNIMCASHQMILQVAGNKPVAKELIDISWETVEDGTVDGYKMLKNEPMELLSPFYGMEKMYGNTNARWVIQGNSLRDMTFQVMELELAPGQELILFEGNSKLRKLATYTSMSRVGDRDLPIAVTTSKNYKAVLEMTSSKMGPGGKFKINVIPGCHVRLNTTQGMIMSPGYGSIGDYPDSVLCVWEITPSVLDRSLKIEFDADLDIEVNDTITVDGLIVSQENLTAVTRESATVIFRSNPHLASSKTGFKAFFSIGCRNLSDVVINPRKGDKKNYTCTGDEAFVFAPYSNKDMVEVTCESGGHWDMDVEFVKCQKRVCGTPPAIGSGFVLNVTSVDGGGIANYKCFPGFSLSPNIPALCQNGSWENVPRCEAISPTCPDLGPLQNGTVSHTNGNGTSLGTVSTYTCDYGFDLIGDKVIVCNIHGNWSKDAPNCRPHVCVIRNYPRMNITGESGARVDGKSVPFGSTVTINCDRGFMVKNGTSPQLTCQGNKTLDGHPVCEDINECDTLNGGCNQTCINTIGAYKCKCDEELFDLGEDMHTCVALDLCARDKPCDESCSGKAKGGYTCGCSTPGKELYTSPGMNGHKTLGNETGLDYWHVLSVNVSCVYTPCPFLNMTIPQGIMTSRHNAFYYPGVTATYRCNIGYVISQSPSIVQEATISCNDSSVWSDQPPTCTVAMCIPFDADSNVYLTASTSNNVTYGEEVSYNCSVPGANQTRFRQKCSYDYSDNSYKMVGDIITCRPIDCGVPSVADDKLVGVNSTYLPLPGSNTTYGSTFEFVCDTNSTLSGNSTNKDSTVTCLSTGYWGLGSLMCRARSCPDPGYPAGGSQGNVVSYEANQFVRFTCDREGYFPEPAAIQCVFTVNGVNWNDTRKPQCVDRTSPVLSNCPDGEQRLAILAGQNPSSHLPKPNATDNTAIESLTFDNNPDIERFGDVNITWTAQDFQGNTAKCVWIVNIVGETPLILTCNTSVTYDLENYNRSGSLDLKALFHPVASDPMAIITFSPNTNELSDLPVDASTKYEIRATDAHNRTAVCTSVLNVISPPCHPENIAKPLNDTFTCSATGNDFACTHTCQADHAKYSSEAAKAYTCVQGQKFSYQAVSNCIKTEPAEVRAIIEAEYTHSLASNCLPKMTELLDQIVTDNLIASYEQQCESSYNNADFNISVDITITKISAVKVKTGFSYLIAGTGGSLPFCANQVGTIMSLLDNAFPSITKSNLASVANINLNGCDACIGNNCIFDYKANTLAIKTPGEGASLGALCAENTVLQLSNSQYVCIPCPTGYFYNGFNCTACEANTFNDKPGQSVCTQCPAGTKSDVVGSTSVDLCKKLCSVGFISPDGMVPCTPCGKDEYWVNSTTCAACPSGTITYNPDTGASSVTQCRAACDAGEFSPSGYDAPPYSKCQACPAGFYQGKNGTTCLGCAMNSTTLSNKAPNDTLCTDVPSITCENGGVPVIINRGQTCNCSEGFTGDRCETNLDPCSSNPCYNNGNCTAVDAVSYTCSCTSETGPVMKFVEFDSDFADFLTASKNVTTLKECKAYCVGTASCAALSFNPNPTNPNPPANVPCLIYSQATGTLGSLNGYTLYKKTNAVLQFYNGSRCEVDPVNDCDSLTCGNGGQCRDQPGYAECLCSVVDVFSGESCTIATSICEKSPCQNGATCIPESQIRRQCQCPAGYTGRNCETVIDNCNPKPCHFGTSCKNSVNKFTCDCEFGFNGTTCLDRPTPPCDAADCGSGRCTNNYINNTADCACDKGYRYNATVRTCEPLDACKPDRCQNNAICRHVGETGYVCDCKPGYEGVHCQHDIDECMPNPCKNHAKCSESIGNFTCNCTEGYEGKLCEEMKKFCDPDPCDPVGSRKDNCTSVLNDFICACKPGYTGKNCSKEVDECASIPCQHGGECVDSIDDYTCTCKPGWTGEHCETMIGLCTPDTCENNAQCYNVSRLTFCQCEKGTFGDRCQEAPDVCLSANPCQNKAKCNSTNGNITCACLPGWEGQFCEFIADVCSKPGVCINGATCVQDKLDYMCHCPPGFKGKNCDLNIKCEDFTCDNGGTKSPKGDGCECKCTSAFTGPRCEVPAQSAVQVEFYGDGQGVYRPFPLSSKFYTLSLFVSYSKQRPNGIFFCLYGLTSADQPLSEGEEVVCLGEGDGNNDGNEYFIALLWNGQPTAQLRVGVSIKYVSVNMSKTFTHGFAVIGGKYEDGNDDSDRFMGRIKSLRLWNLFLESSLTRLKNSGDMSEFDDYIAIPETIPSLTGKARPIQGFQPAPSTKTVPLLEKDGCPSDSAISVAGARSVVANFEDTRFDPATYSTTTVNYASGFPRQTGIYDIMYLAEKDDSYTTCSYNVYVRFGSCDEPNAPIGGEDPVCNRTDSNIHTSCQISCPAGKAFIHPIPRIYTCGALGSYKLDRPNRPFSFPPCGDVLTDVKKDITIKLSYTVKDEKAGATTSPSLNTITKIIKDGINRIDATTSNPKMCDGTCTVEISAQNPKDGLISVEVKLIKVAAVVNYDVPVAEVLKFAILSLDEFNSASVPGKSGFDPSNMDLSGKLNLEIDVLASCDRPYQAVDQVCVKCTKGTYYNSTYRECRYCDVGTYNEIDGQDLCAPCLPGQTTLEKGSINKTDCRNVCEAGYRFNLTDGECVPCGRGFYQPEKGQRACIKCKVGQTTLMLNATSDTFCLDQCEAGQYLTVDQKCQKCPVGTFRKVSDETCQSCSQSTSTKAAGAKDPSECDLRLCAAGQKNVNNTCEPCEIGTFSTSRFVTQCTACSDTGNSSTKAAGASSQDKCEPFCLAGAFFNVNTSKCEACPQDSYKTGDFIQGFKTACTPCPDGLRTEDEGNKAVEDCNIPDCGEGFAINSLFVESPQTQKNPCLKCNISSYQPFPDAYNRTCLPCPGLTFTADMGAKSVNQCIPLNATRLSAEIKLDKACDENTLNPDNADTQKLIKDLEDPENPDSLLNVVKKKMGKKADNVKAVDVKGFRCGSIDVNFDILYVRENDNGQQATDNDVKNALQEVATLGTTIAGSPAIPNSVVVVPRDTDVCEPGQGLNTTSGVGLCEDCPKGTFQYLKIQDTCVPCAVGFTTNSTKEVWDFTTEPTKNPCRKICPAGQESKDNVACAPCGLGSYKEKEGIHDCVKCEPNTVTINPGAISSDLCIASCEPGYQSTEDKGKKVCSSCPVGTYSEEKNSANCTACESDFYSTAGNASDSKSDCLTVCKLGTYCLNDATCVWNDETETPFCQCKVPYVGDRCETRGEPPTSQTTIIVAAVVGAVGGFLLLFFTAFAIIVYYRRRMSKRPRKAPLPERIYGKMVGGNMGPIYGQRPPEGPIYDNTILPGYYPMGIPYPRRYPLIPHVTYNSVANLQKSLPPPQIPQQVVLKTIPRPLEEQSSKFMFYEEKEQNGGTYQRLPGYGVEPTYGGSQHATYQYKSPYMR